MAGERYAKITIQAALSRNDNRRGQETAALRFTMGPQVLTLERGGNPGQFIVPDPDQVGDQYVLLAVQNVLNVLGARIFALGLPYALSAPRTGTPATIAEPDGTQMPVVEFDITATAYGNFNLDFSSGFETGWAIMGRVTNATPIVARAEVTHTGAFGSADGIVEIIATGGDSGGVFLYDWADGIRGDRRTGLAAGKYSCLVSDAGNSGVTTLVVAVVKSDPRLQVEVATTPNSITLTVSGGLAPYTFAWADGPTTAIRLGLPNALYHCLVTDARGTSQEVEVALFDNDRYWFSGNPVVLSLDAGVGYREDPTIKPGLSFVCQVWVEPDYLSDVFVQVGQDLEQPATADGRTTFEVQELLEPYVNPLVPALGAGVVRQDGAFRRFYLKHYERTTAGDGVVTNVDTNYLVHGGLDYWEAAAGTWFSGYQDTYRPFLTWEPKRKKVLPDQPEYLYFMVPAGGATTFYYRLLVSLTDGGLLDEVIAIRPGVQRFEVFCLPAGPGQLDLAAREAQTGQLVTQYTVYVEDADGVALSDRRTYVLDRRLAPTRRYFLYANSLGGWNTLVCRGKGALDLVVKSSTSENARPAGYDPLRGDSTTNRRTGLPVLHCYTGPRSAAQAVADRDFLLSERVLLLDGGRYQPGQIKDRTFTPFDEDETRRVVQFDFELPRERFFTPRLA